MITLDANHVLRLILRDDPRQGRVVIDAIQQAGGGRLQATVVLELLWVLQGPRIGLKAQAAAAALVKVSESDGIQAPKWMPRLTEAVQAGLELDDAVHLLEARPDIPFSTFDRDLARRAQDFVERPKVITP